MDIKVSQKNVTRVIENLSGCFKAKTACVLGSGLSILADELENKKVIPYDSLPGFDQCTVLGHDGNFVFGEIDGVKVLFLQGRPHWYEDRTSSSFHIFIQAIKAFGCERILMTNAAGSLDSKIPVGAMVSITDHINLQFRNPLIGISNAGNSCFVGMENAYDKEFRDELHHIASSNKLRLYEGVYTSTLGPCFETPAEINAFRVLGGQVVGMSTVPEVITARYYGLKVAVVSLISNLAAGCGDKELSHAPTPELR